MKPSTRIVELFIDEEYDESGIEAISLVSRPAHEETWLAFNKQQEQTEEVETLSPYKIVEDDFCDHNPSLKTLGEPYSELINEGWEIVRAEKITPQMVHKMNEQRFSAPNDPSELDTDEMRVRFKYVGPRDERNRRFCADMMSMNRVYRIEDIEELTNTLANFEFGFYSIFLYRGSFNCRHQWYRLFYKPTGQIRNNANSTKGLDGEEGLGPSLQPDTRPEPTIRNVGQPDSNQWRPGTPRQGSFKRDQDMGLEDACWEGYEAIGLKDDGTPNCVPIKMTKDDFADSISDYPQGVKDAASKALNWVDKNGWGSCGTGVGKQRANQLAKGENISVDTVKRMYSYLSRHKTDLQSSKKYEDGCGKLMYDAWGGEAGLTWSERKLKQLENMGKEKKELTSTDMEKWGGVKTDPTKLLFYDDEKKVVVGAAMVPNRMIHRYDELGNMYYVFFSKKSIKKMAEKFLRQKRTDETSIEHNGIKLGSEKVFVTESWVSEDPIKDKSAAYGFNLPAGTWFVSMKIDDPNIWKLVKSGMLTGFSVEGLFAEKSVFSKQEKQINQIKQILKSIKDE